MHQMAKLFCIHCAVDSAMLRQDITVISCGVNKSYFLKQMFANIPCPALIKNQIVRWEYSIKNWQEFFMILTLLFISVVDSTKYSRYYCPILHALYRKIVYGTKVIFKCLWSSSSINCEVDLEYLINNYLASSAIALPLGTVRCVVTCFTIWAFCLNDLLQMLQVKGFSPVWIFKCCLKLNRFELINNPQTGQHLSSLQWSFICRLKLSKLPKSVLHLMQSKGQISFLIWAS